jgi:diguanylate cyclase (GGDEF)-like protein
MFQSVTELSSDRIWWLALLALLVFFFPIVGLIGSLSYSRLREQKGCLDTALNNITQGLTMFDKSGKLVLCNRCYLDMYGLSPAVVKPGCTVRRLVEHRIEMGSLTSGEAEDYVGLRQAAILQDKPVSNIIELRNGRTFVVTRRPMPGGGWVATHEDITQRRHAEVKIAHMARHDALTGLPNRDLLRDKLEAALLRIRETGPLAVLYLDLDDFKGINDSLGHSVGDELLKAVADRLRECLRDTDTIARLGGDEFAIIQTGVEQPSGAENLAREIGEAIKMPFALGGHQVLADVSLGIAFAPGDSCDAGKLLKHADMAMYVAKGEGRATFRLFNSEMDVRASARRTLETDLRRAIELGQFELYYQPIVDLESNEVCSCEALLRWHHPERGMISPDEFIPVAEEAGLIVPLGEWVLRTACAAAAAWPGDVIVAVNVSPVQFRDHALVRTIISALAASGIPAQRLAIEITETALMQNSKATFAALHQLRTFGVRVVMDDFGTGYSSLSYLRSFPFDKIKIDRSFINDVSEMDDARTIVQAVTSLARNLNITTTAEGVETQAQLEKVRALGCTEMQGFLFSPPLPAAQLARCFQKPARNRERTASVG